MIIGRRTMQMMGQILTIHCHTVTVNLSQQMLLLSNGQLSI